MLVGYASYFVPKLKFFRNLRGRYEFKMENWPFKNEIDLVGSLTENKKVENIQSDKLDGETYTKLSKWFGSVPKFSTFRVNTLEASIDSVIENIKQELIEQCERRGAKSMPAVFQDGVLKDCIVVGSWDETDLDLKRREALEVIVDTTCGVAVLRGAHIFAPGVMGISPETKEGNRVSVYADLTGRCLKGWSKPYDDEESRMFIGNGIARMTRKELFEGGTNLKRNGIAVEMVAVTSGLPSFSCPSKYGLLQNYPSILCGHVLNPRPGDVVLDMCAAPGNKTTHIGLLMKNKGTLIALDKTDAKVKRIKENCKRQSLTCVNAYVQDSIYAIDNNRTGGGEVVCGPPPYAAASFDKILLDAPCSALGQRPQFENRVTANQMNSYPPVQRKLFATAVQLLKPGGTLVYSTCTLVVQENEGLVAWALDTFTELQLVPSDPIVGHPASDRVCHLTDDQRRCVQKFGPPVSVGLVEGAIHSNDTIGFFIAKFFKKSTVSPSPPSPE